MAADPVILVTAGSAGLGAATAKLFATKGYRVVINYSTNTKRAETLIKDLNSQNGGAVNNIAIQADLTSQKDVRRLVQEAYTAMGRIDVIFSNGGWTRFTNTTSIDDNVVDEDWNHAFTMNVKSHLWLLQAAKSYLDETEGAFITTSSLAGVYGMGSSLVGSAAVALEDWCNNCLIRPMLPQKPLNYT